ncbi:MAG: Rv2175c family DNA-binding protein [Kineosporiaceae bacterium]
MSTDSSAAAPSTPSAPDSSDFEALAAPWLPLPDVAERLGLEVAKVRRLLQERDLIGARVGERRILCVPEALLMDGEPVPDLRGTLSVLVDSGYSDEEALRWLFTPDESLPGTPVDALRENRRKEVRRRAQALAF